MSYQYGFSYTSLVCLIATVHRTLSLTVLFEFSLACSGFVTYLIQDYLFQQDFSRFSVITEQMKHVSGHLTILLNYFSVLAVNYCVVSAHHAIKSQAKWLIKLRICKGIFHLFCSVAFPVVLHQFLDVFERCHMTWTLRQVQFKWQSACLLLWSKKGDVWI